MTVNHWEPEPLEEPTPGPSPTASVSHLKLFFALSFSLVAIDQLVKFWVRSAAHGVENHTILALWPGVFEVKLVFNEGIAFGMFQGSGILLWPIAIGIASAATLYSVRHPADRPIVHAAMALLAAGSIGNLIDRIMAGRVTDMFFIRAINFPVFNVADACITFAAVLLGYFWLQDAVGGRRKSVPPADIETGTADEQ